MKLLINSNNRTRSRELIGLRVVHTIIRRSSLLVRVALILATAY
jgi:hypothetical protein